MQFVKITDGETSAKQKRELCTDHLFFERSIGLLLGLCFLLCSALFQLGLVLQTERADLKLESL